MSQPLTRMAVSALRWNYAGFLARSVASFAIGVILARLLGPKPFGQLAVAGLAFGLASQLADAGFSAALVQIPELTPLLVRFAFTVQLVIGVLVTGIVMLAAPFLALAFHDPAVTEVLRMIAPVFFLQALGQTSTGLLKRQLAFRDLQIAQVTSYLGGYLLVGIPAALLGYGVWSLVAAQLTQAVLYSGLVYYRTRHPLGLCIRPGGFRLLSFGTKVTAANIVNWSISNIDTVIVGQGYGSTALGYYSRAFNLASTPADGVVSTCQQVLFASCSRAQEELPKLRRAYLATVAAIALILLPMFWSMAACASTVVTGILGTRWAEAVPLFLPLALALPLNAIMALAGSVLGATNRVEQELRMQALSLGVSAVLYLIAIRYSVTAVAWAVLLAYAFRLYVATRPTLRLLSLHWADVARAVQGPVLLAVVTSLCAALVDRTVSTWTHYPVAALALTALAGFIGLTGTLLVAADRIFSSELREFLTRLSPELSNGIAYSLRQKLTKFLGTSSSRREAGDQPPAPVPSVFIATILPEVGESGVQTHLRVARQCLQEHGVPVEVLTPHETPRLLRRAVGGFYKLCRLLNQDLATYWWRHLDGRVLRYRMNQRMPADQPWTVYAQCPVSACAALALRRRSDQQVILIVHFNLSQADEMADCGRIVRDGWVYRSVLQYEKRILLDVNQVLYPSEFMRSHLIRRIDGLERQPSAVVPNFVGTPEPAETGPHGDLITFGSLEPRKNHEFLLRVLAEAKTRGHQYSLTIVGKGELEEKLKRLAGMLGVSEQVTFAGYIPNASCLLYRHRAYVHSATIENLPLSLIEAIAAGLPVIAPSVGGIPEIITDHVEGRLWDVMDPAASADLLISVLSNQMLEQRMSVAARQKYAARFSPERVAPQLVSLLSNADLLTNHASTV